MTNKAIFKNNNYLKNNKNNKLFPKILENKQNSKKISIAGT